MSIALICASAYAYPCAYPDRSVISVDKRFPIIRTSRPPPRFFEFANQNSQAKQTLYGIISGKWRKTGLGGGAGGGPRAGGGGGAGGGSGGGKGEGEDRFDRNRVVPMLGSPEMARELESLLKQLGEYEFIVKWLVFRRLKLQKGVVKDRWLADDYMFLAHLLIGYGLWLFGKVMARVAVTRLSCYLPATVSLCLPIGFNAGILNACPDNAFQVMGIVADIMLSFIPAPTSLSLRPPVGVDTGSIAQILFVCLHKAFQAKAIVRSCNPPNEVDAGSITEFQSNAAKWCGLQVP